MGFFVIVVILAILAVVGFFGGKVAKNENPDGPGGIVSWGSLIAGVVLFVAVVGFSSFTTIPNGHIGLVKQFNSYVGVKDQTGLTTKLPWQSLDQVSVQNEHRIYQMGSEGIEVGNVRPDVHLGAAVSKDSQAVSLLVQVNYQLDPAKAVALYKSTGGQYVSKLLDGAVFDHSKAATASFKVSEFAGNRELIRGNIDKLLSKDLEPQGIKVLNVLLLDVGYSKTFSQAVENTVQATQQAKAAEQTVKIKTAEAQQAVAEAKGQATATLVQARADAEAQRLKQKTLTPLLVQMAAIDKLNPDVQVIVCDPKQNCVPQAFVGVNPVGTKTTP